ncbi:MAG: hypothetical protein ABJQ29_08560 [Luteolibacter sp.]
MCSLLSALCSLLSAHRSPLTALESDVKRGRSTEDADVKNDTENIKIWK